MAHDKKLSTLHSGSPLPSTRTRTPTDADGRWLAFIPVGMAAVMLLLVMPHATAPTDIPLPSVDGRALARVAADDSARAKRARATRLPNDALGFGSAIRALNVAQVKNDDAGFGEARRALEDSGRDLSVRKDSMPDLLELRAVQLDDFLASLAAFESTGEESTDFVELGGKSFTKRAQTAGWTEGRHLILDEPARRAMFKTVWNGISGFDRAPELALSIDEEKALYRMYLAHPHSVEAERLGLESELAAANTNAECQRAQENQARSVEQWRIEKIKRLSQIDPTYPASYALGVGYFRAGRYEASIDNFQRWIEKHPEGALSLRARNHLKAAAAAAL